MDLVQVIRAKAKQQKRTIVLPEGEDPRVIEAAKIIERDGIAKTIVLTKATLDSQKKKQYADAYFAMRQSKGMTREEADAKTAETIMYGAMMVREGLADGFVAGSLATTADVARAAFHCFGMDKRFMLMTSSFIMIVPDCAYGEKGIFLFADCGIIPNPKPRQLAAIAVSTAELAQKLLGIPPRVAMLSYSTKGSAEGEMIDKVKEATALAREMAPDLIIDGELQADAAIIPDVAKSKNKNGIITGNANVLVFPDLDAGNIAYKLVQRLAKARAIGPLIQGLNAPCSDLSRGCSVDDIIDCVAITAIRTQTPHS